MPWFLIVSVLFQFLGPFLLDWLYRQLSLAALSLEKKGVYAWALSPEEGLALLFAEAKANTSWWSWGQRWRLTSLENALKPRAQDLWLAAKQGTNPPAMTPVEQDLLKSLI